MLGGVQPDKLEMILNGPDDGLTSRLLWAWPGTKPEFNLARGAQDDGPMQRAFARLSDLLQIHDEFGHPEPMMVPLSREAEDRLEAFARDIVERCHMASGLLAGTLGKARAGTACAYPPCWNTCGGAAAPRSPSRGRSHRRQ